MVRVENPRPEIAKEPLRTQFFQWFQHAGLVEGVPIQNTDHIREITPDDLEDLFSFGIAPYFDSFPPLLNDQFIIAVAAKAFELQRYERKASKKLYVRHVLAVLGELWKSAIEPYLELGDIQSARILIMGAFLHDTVELQRKYHIDYTLKNLRGSLTEIDQETEPISTRVEEIDRLTRITEEFTPHETPSHIRDRALWLLAKLEPFEAKLHLNIGINTHPFLLIEAADICANIYETITDFNLELDGGMDRPLSDRLFVFRRRIEMYLMKFPNGLMSRQLIVAYDSVRRLEAAIASDYQAQS
ncbi:MAG: hypothetical protein WC775_04570 [Patescibacteria group bacterium]|jgi:hypothetical protein